jgi:YbbR domain-containing protein
VLERLRNNLDLKLLSLTIAVALWAYLRLTPNSLIAARFTQQFNVPIETTGLAEGLISRFTEKVAVVAVAVPRDGAPVNSDMLRAVLNVEGRGPGVYNVPVEVIAPKLEIKSLSPASVTLSIERIEARTMPVSLHYSGPVHPGVVVQRTEVVPATATLHAPTSDLARVASLRVDIPFPSNPSTFDAMVRPFATDAHGVEMPAISVAPNLLRVRVRFVASQRGK